MPHVFHPFADTVARAILITVLVLPFVAIGIGYWLSASEYNTERTLITEQPIPFSHQHHVGGLGLDCRYCHTGVETSSVAGVPPTHTCMTCHSQLYTQAKMLAPVRESLANNTPIRWNKVNRLPDYVYFDHSIHIAKGVACTNCHGDVSTMPLIRQTAPLTMGWCLDCHRNPAPNLGAVSDVFDPNLKRANDPSMRDAALVHPRIDNTHLTDCSACHR
ncbi:MAG TPA: cytochrome c3 family protein [Bradyrhizobium sp.]|nr:cytochrome c3 family protein [Bradyrhizobium sp.]